MAKVFEVHESFKHTFAKDLLLRWLRDHERDNKTCNFCGLAWRPNWGIYPELKFYKTSHLYYFEEGINSGRVLFIPDITIFHKGQAFILLEIVHRNKVSPQKAGRIRNFFGANHYEIYEIEADTILNNTCTPTFLTLKNAA